ncbi:MAG: carbohydrate ABC transporter permease [Herpetosiphon sp.]
MMRTRLVAPLLYLLFAGLIAFFVTPFIWLLFASFDGQATAFVRLPQPPTTENFHRLFTEYNFAVALGNSLLVATSTMLLTVVVVALASYTLSRWEMRGKGGIMYGLLLLQTMPLSATMVPIYGLTRTLHLRNSYLGLILIHATIELPFLIWVMKGFFDSVPRALEEAAWMDGRSRLRGLYEIVLPVARPGLAVIAGLSFLAAWSEVLLVLILVDGESMKTVPLKFYEAFRTQGGYSEVRYEVVAAMALVYLFPVMLLFLGTRRYLVRGIAGGTRGA